MDTASRGLLDTVSPALLAYLFGFLPQNDPLTEWVPGELLTPEFVQRLRESQFTGFALAKLPKGHGLLVFYKGRLLEAWRQEPHGYEAGTTAYRNLMAELALGGLSLYKLRLEGIPCLLSLTQGSPRFLAVAPRSLQLETLLDSLRQEHFSGALVVEDGSAGRAWYFYRGQPVFSPDLPRDLREGRVHLLQSPGKAPQDLFEVLQREEEERRRQQSDRMWESVEQVLREYMGRGAAGALERLRKSLPEENPELLRQGLARWLTQTLEPGAAKLFEQLIQRPR
ncbi:hypothetical protein Mterra_02939 [Calidithermus terrae]|uniref:DUF4388 domain-containing protein n=1 Tax=Calidithermus terrae TaxID=1408545 RepID=A0A399EFL3_9DEIN|nr:hypothetical protein [Calidithermus terrae]RIH81840.1 hypothetical protein Mterra_02939 [Calidithermus terrae]